MGRLNGIGLVFAAAALAWIGIVTQDLREFTSIDPAATPEQTAALLDEVLENAVGEYSIAGVAAGALRNGEVIWTARRGRASANGAPITDETAFNLGSISKTFTVWGVMSLAQEGRIDLDSPIGTYLTRFALPDNEFEANGVTVRRLLQHMGGINQHGFGGWGASEEGRPENAVELAQITQPILLVREPGSRWSYSGGGYVLLQMMVEDITGQSFDAFIRERVFMPLDMHSAGFVPADLPNRSAAFAYYGNEIEDLDDIALAAAGAYASANDIEQFLRAHMDGADVLSQPWFDEVFEASEGTSQKGMSYSRRETPRGMLFGHGGNNSAWNAQIYIRPDTGDAFYFLANSTSGAQLDFDLSCAWLSAILEEGVEDVCNEAREVTKNISLLTIVMGLTTLLIAYWVVLRLVRGTRQLRLVPVSASPLRLTTRLIAFALTLIGLGVSAWLFYTNSMMWRTEVTFMDEMPVNEIAMLLRAILAVLAMLAVALWSSPKQDPARDS